MPFERTKECKSCRGSILLCSLGKVLAYQLLLSCRTVLAMSDMSEPSMSLRLSVCQTRELGKSKNMYAKICILYKKHSHLVF